MARRLQASGLPSLPALIDQKLVKSGYTRGATTKEPFQNRVTRNNPVLIDLAFWEQCRTPDDGTSEYENGFIVLVEPTWYFETENADEVLLSSGLALGVNALLFFKRRLEWSRYAKRSELPNGQPLVPASSRTAPLGGNYLARVHATVSSGDGAQVIHGFNTTALRGAGIRVYEYASSATIRAARLQLEALIWHCHDAEDAMLLGGMSETDIAIRRDFQLSEARKGGLLDLDRLHTLRILNLNEHTICPLCQQELSASDFFRRTEQAAGREVHDLTTTEISLFHIQELRVGKLQHKIYNLGWGHNFCNVVAKDAGIIPTLQWMRGVLDGQGDSHQLEEQAESVEQAVEGSVKQAADD